MAISSLVQSEAASTIAQTFTATSSSVYTQATKAFAPGIYTVSCSTSTVAVVDFYAADNGEIVTTATTVSGTVSVNIAENISKIGFYINTGTNVLISITLTGEPISGAPSGTLDTVTTSSTYNTTGQLFVVCVGGSGGGGGGAQYRTGGAGGTSGFAGSRLFTNNAQTITIGSGGTGGTSANTSQSSGNGGNSGGATSFGNLLTANGGAGGGQANTVTDGTNGAQGGPLSGAPFSFMSTPGVSGGNGGTRSNNYNAPGNSGSSGFVYVLRGL